MLNLGNFALFGNIRDLRVDGCRSNLYVMLNQLLFFMVFFKFEDFFYRHSSMNRPCFVPIIQDDNFRNLIRVE